jgi:hypothetical protein
MLFIIEIEGNGRIRLRAKSFSLFKGSVTYVTPFFSRNLINTTRNLRIKKFLNYGPPTRALEAPSGNCVSIAIQNIRDDAE